MCQRIEPQCDSVDESGPLRGHCLVQGNWSMGPLEELKVVPMGTPASVCERDYSRRTSLAPPHSLDYC